MNTMVRAILLAIGSIAAILNTGANASAAEISEMSINDDGDLQMRFVDVLPPLQALTYTLEADTTAVYVCANERLKALFEPRYRLTVGVHLTSEATLLSNYKGVVNGVGMLNQEHAPFVLEQSFPCPNLYRLRLAEVVYTNIRITDSLGRTRQGPDKSSVWFVLPPLSSR
ncbi:hypothetical protein [Sorangium sp. So ce1099]|uniref:hypothetical protein n=1 Tax=Sorangium sp. So ce1099 TaxID=3133331 RepID=UPI003F5FE941